MHIHTHTLIVVTMRIRGSELCMREDGGYRQVCVRLSHIVATAQKCIPSACCIGHIIIMV